MKRIYVIWGGFLGFDGVITSAGLVALQSQLKAYGPVKSYLQQSSYICANDIYNECSAADIAILIGYSGGSVMATRICNDPLLKRNQTINLLVNIDGSPAENMQSVGKNVKAILNVYDPNPWMFGGGIAKGAPSHDVLIDIPHITFQASTLVRQTIVKAVAAL